LILHACAPSNNFLFDFALCFCANCCAGFFFFCSIKCYKLFNEPLSFYDAERTCNTAVGFSSINRHLVHIRDRVELENTKRLCRGLTYVAVGVYPLFIVFIKFPNLHDGLLLLFFIKTMFLFAYLPILLLLCLCSGSVTHSKGCWIGLQDPAGVGRFNWIRKEAIGDLSPTSVFGGYFMDWRRGEPNNHSISEGRPTIEGERCGSLVPWQEDPLVLEQGSWTDAACESRKPFICQVFGGTHRFNVYATEQITATSGTIEGGIITSGAGVTELYDITLRKSAMLVVPEESIGCWLGTVRLLDGSSLVLNADASTISGAFIGEPLDTTTTAAVGPGVLFEDVAVSSIISEKVPVESSTTLPLSDLSMQPTVTLSSSVALTLGPLCTALAPSGCSAASSDVYFNAKVFMYGTLRIAAATNVSLLQVVATFFRILFPDSYLFVCLCLYAGW
jgi:hypothetical protein